MAVIRGSRIYKLNSVAMKPTCFIARHAVHVAKKCVKGISSTADCDGCLSMPLAGSFEYSMSSGPAGNA
jgi:hypothetical protein